MTVFEISVNISSEASIPFCVRIIFIAFFSVVGFDSTMLLMLDRFSIDRYSKVASAIPEKSDSQYI